VVDQTTAATPGDSPGQAELDAPAPGADTAGFPATTDLAAGPDLASGPDAAAGPERAAADSAGFGSRGRMRRRARFLHKARELAYRDLGGLVFNLHRFGQRNDPLVLAKLGTLGQIDAELRALENVLAERQPVTVLREAGVTACPRCAAIHSSEDAFCPSCGLSLGRHAELPIAGALAPAAPAAPEAAPQPVPAPAPAPALAQPAAAEAGAGAFGRAPGAAPPEPGTPGAGPAATPPEQPEREQDLTVQPAGGEEATAILHPSSGGS